MNRRPLLLGSLALTLGARGARAQAEQFSDGIIRLGVLNDRSGPFADLSGEGSAIGARMAAEEFGGRLHGVPIEVVTADHHNKPDLGLAIARKWFDVEGVDAIFSVDNSAVSLAIADLVKDRKKLVLHNSATVALSGPACTARSLQWQYTTWSVATHLVSKEMIQGGLDTFFLLVVDFAYGEATASPFRAAVGRLGGKIVGETRHPLGQSDLSSYLLEAQGSGAKGLMLANAGSDLANSIKQAREFGLTPKTQLLTASVTRDVTPSVGLDLMQGLLAVSWYDPYRDAAALAWARKFAERNRGRFPVEPQASTYSAALNYLKAVDAAGTDDADIVLAGLRKMSFNDAFASHGYLRADGVMAHDMYRVRLKAPSQSSGPGDYSNIIATIPADDVNLPLAESVCPLVKRPG